MREAEEERRRQRVSRKSREEEVEQARGGPDPLSSGPSVSQGEGTGTGGCSGSSSSPPPPMPAPQHSPGCSGPAAGREPVTGMRPSQCGLAEMCLPASFQQPAAGGRERRCAVDRQDGREGRAGATHMPRLAQMQGEQTCSDFSHLSTLGVRQANQGGGAHGNRNRACAPG